MMRWCIIRWEMRRSRIRRSISSIGRLLFFAGFLGDFFPLPRPRPLPAIRRIWWDWSKGMISIYNNAVVDCRDTVEEWWERRLPTSFYTLWIDVMRDLRRRNLLRATCRSPRSCCCSLGGRPRSPRLRCRGALQKTRRRRFPPNRVKEGQSQIIVPPSVAEKARMTDSGIPGCPYRFLESDELPFIDGNPAYGLQLHHPRFLELLGAPESARLLDRASLYWVEEMCKERAMVAAATLQRDAGVMLSNLQILSQFAMALNQMSFSMMALGLDRSVIPGAEVDALSPAPRARRAAPYMSAMGLWCPQENPTAPRPAPTPSCNLCRNCKHCFPDN